MNLKPLALSFLASLIVLASATAAQAQPTSSKKWDFQSSHGMKACSFAAFGVQGASTNVEVTQTAPGAVTVTVQEGTKANLKMQCAYAMTWNSEKGLYDIGPEVSYSANPGGSGTSVGQLAPDDSTPKDYRSPLGRLWPITAGAFGSAPVVVTLTGGSDSIRVTIVSGQSPASKADLKPIDDKAKETGDKVARLEEDNKGGYERRIFELHLNYLHDLDSIGKDYDDRRGWGGGFTFFAKPWETPVVKLTIGLEADSKARQKPIAAAPDVAPNGYSSYVDSHGWTLTPMFGFDVMPASFFQFYLRGGLGLMVHEDPATVLSQDSSKWIFTQESNRHSAFAYRAELGFNFVIPAAKWINPYIGAAIGLSGNITKLPEAAGPELICGVKIPQCTKLREGYFTDIPIFIRAGAAFNLL